MTVELAIIKIKEKDQNGLLFFYDNYANALMGIIVRIVHSEQLGEEVLQETFMKVWTKIDSYDSTKSTFYTWMARIARNTAIDVARLKKNKYQRDTLSLDPAIHDSKVTIDHSKLDIEKLTKKLDEKYKIVLDYVYLMGYSHSEAAIKLDLPIGTVKTRLRKAILILREELKKEKTIFISAIILVMFLIQLLWN